MQVDKWERWRSKCGELSPSLARLHDVFKAIAAGEHDSHLEYSEVCVTAELESILDELKDSFEPKSRYTTDLLP